MNRASLPPFRLKPAYKDYLWGGDRIIRRYARAMPPGIYAESWEVSDRDEGMSIVAEGPLSGQSLAAVVKAHGPELLGRAAERFPLLVKLIDARTTLSVQVHPDDDAARRHGGEPKTEMWHVLEADPGAFVYCGFLPGIVEADLREALLHDRVEALLHRVPVRAGDTVFMPAGCVHAIGAGCLMFECQQNSNTTYRLYDYGRTGPDGKRRPLHVEEAIKVINWSPRGAGLVASRPMTLTGDANAWTLVHSPFFNVRRVELRGQIALEHAGCCTILYAMRGDALIRWPGGALSLVPGETAVVPARADSVQVAGDEASLLVVFIP